MRKERRKRMTGTVFTLEPAYFTVMHMAMRGTVQAGREVIPIRYSNFPDPMRSPWDYNTQGGVRMLNAALTSGRYAKPYIIFGWSMGAQVAMKWLNEEGPKCTIDPADLSIISIGNPERRYGGVLGMMRGAADGGGMQVPGWAGGVQSPPSGSVAQYVRAGNLPGVPAGNRYPVIDLARQYDYFADYPTVLNPNSKATGNASTSVHMNYFSVTLNDDNLVSYGPENNVTYLWSPSSSQGSAEIESAYDRPVDLP